MLLLAMLAGRRLETRLREVRLARGLSQERLAQEVGVTRQTIVNIEKGLTVPNVLIALAISGVLAIAVDELFHMSGSR
jgi:putative transcriptional regulator